jgi:hypothetical protein
MLASLRWEACGRKVNMTRCRLHAQHSHVRVTTVQTRSCRVLFDRRILALPSLYINQAVPLWNTDTNLTSADSHDMYREVSILRGYSSSIQSRLLSSFNNCRLTVYCKDSFTPNQNSQVEMRTSTVTSDAYEFGRL